MSNSVHIETLLDELVKGKRSAKPTEVMLAENGDSNPEESIAVHMAAVEAIKRFTILQQVGAIHAEYKSKITPAEPAPVRSINKKIIRWTMGVAASLILFLAGLFGYEYFNNSSEKVYSSVYQSYTINTERKSTEIPENTQIILAFKAKDYSTVIKITEGLTKPGNREKFLAAYSYHQTGDYEKAINFCNQILETNRTTELKLYNDEAEFYAALSYLKLNKIKEAARLFSLIQENNRHTFHERVSEKTIRRLNWLK